MLIGSTSGSVGASVVVSSVVVSSVVVSSVVVVIISVVVVSLPTWLPVQPASAIVPSAEASPRNARRERVESVSGESSAGVGSFRVIASLSSTRDTLTTIFEILTQLRPRSLGGPSELSPHFVRSRTSGSRFDGATTVRSTIRDEEKRLNRERVREGYARRSGRDRTLCLLSRVRPRDARRHPRPTDGRATPSTSPQLRKLPRRRSVAAVPTAEESRSRSVGAIVPSERRSVERSLHRDDRSVGTPGRAASSVRYWTASNSSVRYSLSHSRRASSSRSPRLFSA